LSHLVQVFLAEDAFVQLQDEFVDKENDLQKFVYEQVRLLARAAKLVKLNKSFQANLEGDPQTGETHPEIFSLKEIKLETFDLSDNPSWLPKKFIKEETKTYDIKVGEKTWELLKLYGQVYCARLDAYNTSISPTDPQRKNKIQELPTCMQQLLHEHLVEPVYSKISAAIDSELDKEFNEINKPEEKK